MMASKDEPLPLGDFLPQYTSLAAEAAAIETPQGPGGEESEPIRVLVAEISGVIFELIARVVREQPDLQLVGPVYGRVNLLLATATGIHVLILGASLVSPPPGICSHLLSEFPELKIIVMKPNGEEAVLYWLGLRHRRLSDLSPAGLVTRIRQVYRLNPAV